MIDVLDIVISNQEAVSKELDIIYSSNMKQYRARFTFSDNSWDGYNKIVIFDRVKNYDTPIGLIVKDKASELVEIINDREFYCIIPWEILIQPGYFTISLYGTITDGEPKKKTIVINNKFTIQNSGNTTVYPRIPTPNIYEQLLGITDTKDIKEDLESLEKELQIIEENIDKKIDELDKKIEEQPTSYVGKATENGGEIFNDYENNKALAQYSSASGYGTNSVGIAQTVVGQFNSLNGESYFIVGNGTDNNNRSTAFKVNHDGSAEIQTSGINDLNVVNYKQLKDYVAQNAQSQWDNACKLLFTEAEYDWNNIASEGGDVYIYNHQVNDQDSNGYITIGKTLAYNNGQKCSTITNSSFMVQYLVNGFDCILSTEGLILSVVNPTGRPEDELNDYFPSIHLQAVINANLDRISTDIGMMGLTHQNNFVPWENIVEAANLFSNNYDLQIKNHPVSNESFSSITIGEAQSSESGKNFSRLNANGLYVHNVISGNTSTYDESKVFIRTSCTENEDYKGYIHLEHTIRALDDSSEINTDDLEITASSIKYNGKVFEWKRIFDVIEKIENTIDVSINGQ